MPVLALIQRIIRQLKHDRRTLALLFVAPLLVLTLLYCILVGSNTSITVAAVNCPVNYIERLESQNVKVLRMTEAEANSALYNGEIIAAITLQNNLLQVELDGSNASNSKLALSLISAARAPLTKQTSGLDINYIYGYEGLTMFDNFGSVLIGFIIFFFVFLIAGISFLQERTSGTLEKLLSTPIKRWQIVAGYVLGFGTVTCIQATLITSFCIYVLHVMMVGNFLLVLLTAILAATAALTLGILLSTIANNAFQMIQFIPIVIVPQVFFSGLFELSPALEIFGKIMPLHYVANALTQVMIKGGGFMDIIGDLSVLAGCSILFMSLNVVVLKRYRSL